MTKLQTQSKKEIRPQAKFLILNTQDKFKDETKKCSVKSDVYVTFLPLSYSPIAQDIWAVDQNWAYFYKAFISNTTKQHSQYKLANTMVKGDIYTRSQIQR